MRPKSPVSGFFANQLHRAADWLERPPAPDATDAAPRPEPRPVMAVYDIPTPRTAAQPAVAALAGQRGSGPSPAPAAEASPAAPSLGPAAEASPAAGAEAGQTEIANPEPQPAAAPPPVPEPRPRFRPQLVMRTSSAFTPPDLSRLFPSAAGAPGIGGRFGTNAASASPAATFRQAPDGLPGSKGVMFQRWPEQSAGSAHPFP